MLLQFAPALIILAANAHSSELSVRSAVALQIGTHVYLWLLISFGVFWLADVLDSIHVNKGGKAQLEAGVYGCRVGFNGERIHFGSSGCRCVGGNKNRGLIDYSVENVADNTLTFV